MDNDLFNRVDQYISELLGGEDEALRETIQYQVAHITCH